MWNCVDISRLESCVSNMSEYNKVFPGFILAVGEKVKKQLEGDFLKMQVWAGPYARENIKLLHPQMKEPYYLDWVCFGFEGYPAEDAHVGILFDVSKWPITYRIGVHALEDIWKSNEQKIREEISNMGEGLQEYAFQPAFKEYQLNDTAVTLDCAALDQALIDISHRAVELYRRFNKLLKRG